MYATCLFCNRALGENTVLEEFPVGRRIAFDAAKGRLWVVCRKCERWNLSPIEERWEAIEAAERLFSGTRMRVSTDQIGLARHAEGLELVRIGQPLRPEFAAWRYGDQFGRRRRRAIITGVGAVAVLGTIAGAGVATGFISAGLLGQSGNFINLWQNTQVLLKLPTGDGTVLKLKRPDLSKARLRRDGADGWAIVLPKGKADHVFTGPDAERVAGLIMPKLNASGASAKHVQTAVQQIERAGGPQQFLTAFAESPPLDQTKLAEYKHGAATATFAKLPTPSKLALEMVLHEEHERRALEGELKGLQLAWQAAEEIAAISDDLLIPDDVRERLRAESSNQQVNDFPDNQ